MSITHDKFAEQFGFKYLEDGGVAAAAGFKATGVHAGFRKNPSALDLALVVASEPASAAATFTQNVFCAAPVQFSKAQLEASSGSPSYGRAQAIVINSGNANAATGISGMRAAEKTAEIASDILGIPEDEILVASTGVIGVQLPVEKFAFGIEAAKRELSEGERGGEFKKGGGCEKNGGCEKYKEDGTNASNNHNNTGGHSAARAIMTTDTCPKECAVEFSGDDIGFPDVTFTIGGMAKGSGMIMPNMATMISIITTDVPIAPTHLYTALRASVNESFNKVTVDSDTSTNDTCFAMASGKALQSTVANNEIENAHKKFAPGEAAFEKFQRALTQVCITLARAIAKDGEGATKLVDVNIFGAKTLEDADLAARTIANSPLVKTAIAGHDANWGRIAAALGRSGATFNQEDVDISIMGIPVCKAGLNIEFDEDEALRRFEEQEISIDVNLGAGHAKTTIWTCDLTHDYISINADYRT